MTAPTDRRQEPPLEIDPNEVTWLALAAEALLEHAPTDRFERVEMPS